MSWIVEYCRDAEETDRLSGHGNHAALLAAGLFGEAGSVLAELKEAQRETGAYPFHRNRLMEEMGGRSLVLRPSRVCSCPVRGPGAG